MNIYSLISKGKRILAYYNSKYYFHGFSYQLSTIAKALIDATMKQNLSLSKLIDFTSPLSSLNTPAIWLDIL